MKIYLDLLKTYLSSQKPRVLLLAVLVIVSIALRLANPQFVRFFLDSIESGSPLNRLLGAAGLFMLVALVRQGFDIAATFVGEQVAWRATNDLRADLAAHCLALDLSFHKQNKPGELIERVDGDVNLLATFFSTLVIQLVTNVLLLLGVVALLWQIDYRIGASMTAVFLFGLVVINWLRKQTVPRWGRLRAAETRLFGSIEEWLSNTDVIRTSRAEPYIMNQLHVQQRERWHTMRSAMRMHMLVNALPISIFMLAYIAAHIFGTLLYRDSVLTIGTVYLIFYYIDVIRDPLWQITRQIEDLQRAAASIERIAALFQEQPTIRDGAGVGFDAGALRVTFDNVGFYYSDEPETAVLQAINFTLEPGEVLGLLGRTGSGKSTLTRLLFRFYEVTNGSIRLDGHDIRSATQTELRQRIGMVTQEVELLNASLRDNLTLFDPTISDEAIVSTLQRLGLNEWLDALPNRLDTYIASSKELSAGQAQLLAFARVFLFDPGLVILDEASSRLDPATEQLIEQAIDFLLDGRTAIIIAHRLETVQRADQIMILENGRVIEHGERDTLRNNPTSYFARLLKTGLAESQGDL